MSDLTEFLRARLDEDEAAARAVEPLAYVTDMGGTRLDEKFSHARIRFAAEDGWPQRKSDAAAERHFARHDPARVLREVAAKRAILDAYEANDSDVQLHLGDFPRKHGEWDGLRLAVRQLAAIYSDHPAYRPDYR